MAVYVLPLGRSAVAPVCLVRPGKLRLVPIVQPERGESLLTSAAITMCCSDFDKLGVRSTARYAKNVSDWRTA
jgi:hypothetical protein